MERVAFSDAPFSAPSGPLLLKRRQAPCWHRVGQAAPVVARVHADAFSRGTAVAAQQVARSRRGIRSTEALLGSLALPLVDTGCRILHAVGRGPLVADDLQLLAQAARSLSRVLVTRTVGTSLLPGVWPVLVLVVTAASALDVAGRQGALLVLPVAEDHPLPHGAKQAPVRLAPHEVRVRHWTTVGERHLHVCLLTLVVAHLVRTQRVPQAWPEEAVPPLVLLPDPRRHPGGQHGVDEHLHQGQGPTGGETPSVAVLRVEPHDQVLHAKEAMRRLHEGARAPLDRLQRVREEFLLSRLALGKRQLPELPVPALRRHIPPVGNHRGARVVGVLVAEDAGAVCREGRRHHQHGSAGRLRQLAARMHELPIEFIQ